MLSSVADWRPTWGQQLCLFVLLRPYPQPDHALTQESLSFWAERMSLQKKKVIEHRHLLTLYFLCRGGIWNKPLSAFCFLFSSGRSIPKFTYINDPFHHSFGHMAFIVWNAYVNRLHTLKSQGVIKDSKMQCYASPSSSLLPHAVSKIKQENEKNKGTHRLIILLHNPQPFLKALVFLD